jgi:hypothetical protein
MASPHNADYHWTQHFNSPRAVAGTAKRNPQLMAFGGAVGAAGATQLEPVRRKMKEKSRSAADDATAAVVGGAAGQAAYQVGGYGAKKANQRINDKKVYNDPKRRKGYRDPQYKRKVEGNKSRWRAETATGDYKNYQRSFPKDVPGGKVTRALGHTHAGNRGVLVGSAATALGAGLGLAAHRKNKKDGVKKMHDPFGITKSASSGAKMTAKLRRIKTQQGNAFKTYEQNIKAGQQKDAFRSYEPNISATQRRVRNRRMMIGGAGAAGAGAGGGAAYAYDKKVRKSMSVSAFGVDHGEVSKAFAMPKVSGFKKPTTNMSGLQGGFKRLAGGARQRGQQFGQQARSATNAGAQQARSAVAARPLASAAGGAAATGVGGYAFGNQNRKKQF